MAKGSEDRLARPDCHQDPLGPPTPLLTAPVGARCPASLCPRPRPGPAGPDKGWTRSREGLVAPRSRRGRDEETEGAGEPCDAGVLNPDSGTGAPGPRWRPGSHDA